MTTCSVHNRIGRAIAVVVAGSVFGVGSSLALAAAQGPVSRTPEQRAAELAPLADFAVEEGLSGLSPASLRPVND